MEQNEAKTTKTTHALSLLYALAFSLTAYFLYLSRTDEVLTVWGVIHPNFIPTFVFATFLLLAIVFSSTKTHYKLIFVILHSILSHSLMIVIFPAGNVGVQQTILGQTRLVFDDLIFQGLGATREGLPLVLYVSLRGENLQAAFSVVSARMLGIDVYWTHLLLVPLLWGTFVPLIAFKLSKTLGANEKIAALAAVLTMLFSTTIMWGAVSIPNGLSYLFFFCFLFFLLRYIKGDAASDRLLSVVLFVVSSLAHFLAGTIAFALLVLAYSVKSYEKEKHRTPTSAKLTLLLALIFSASILPFMLANRHFLYPTANTHFSLQKIQELPLSDTALSLLLGRYFDLISREAYITTLAFGLPPFISLIALVYLLVSKRHRLNARTQPLLRFILLSYLLIAIDDRITNLFMVNVPFTEIDRLWVFRDLLLIPFAALFIVGALFETRAFFERISRNVFRVWRRTPALHVFPRKSSTLTRGHLAKRVSLGSLFAYVLIFLLVSAWVNASVYYAYPHWAPLQTTSYELKVVKYLDETTDEKYIVIADPWTIFAGQMFVGIRNPRAFYFSSSDPNGITLFVKAKYNPSNETLLEALKYNNATRAYFVIGKPRVGAEAYNDIIELADQNGLKTYHTVDHKGEEKI
nr:hypothetical protein [Candidatus Bathyarchaeota archaeon]